MTVPKSPRLKRGDRISARFLNGHSDQIDALRGQLMRLARGAGVQSIDTQADRSNLSPLQLLDPAVDGAGVTQGVNAGRVMREIVRVVSTVRVTNPSDPAQFVDVERVDVIAFEDDTGERLTLVFDN